MSAKVYKNTRAMGQATVEGLSFPESAIMATLREMFHDVQAKVEQDGAITTSPAVIKFIVEQEVIVND